MTGGVLYISYDGMLEPLGESQVLAYLERLATTRRIDLISFEKPADLVDRERVAAVRERCLRARIHWHPKRYHQSPSAPATAYDIAAGIKSALGIVRRHKPVVVHARSYVAGSMALAVRRLAGTKFLFDMRGFWADERVDGGLWPPGGRLYRAAKAIERRLLRGADHVVTLTHAAVDHLPALAGRKDFSTPVTVIPTCADLDRFALQPPPPARPFVLGHIGAVGTWYLLDEMVRSFAAVQRHRPDARWLIVNRGEHQAIHDAIRRHSIAPGSVELTSARPADMPALIGRMHAGMAIIRPAFSKIASAPTKLAEYLGCGRPCLGNHGVGDMQQILDGRRVGVVIHEFDEAGLSAAALDLLDLVDEPGTAARCRDAALDLFSLDRGAKECESIYRSLGG